MSPTPSRGALAALGNAIAPAFADILVIQTAVSLDGPPLSPDGELQGTFFLSFFYKELSIFSLLSSQD